MTVLTGTVTAEQLESVSDRCELVDGVVVAMAPAGYEHGRVTGRITGLVAQAASDQRLGDVLGAETGFLLARDPDTVRAPDLAFVAADRVPADVRERAYFELAPDLVVEVVSPSDSAAEVLDKALAWTDAGVRLVCVVYPRQHLVAVHRPGRPVEHVRDVLDLGEVLPGLSIGLAELFV